MKEVAKDDAMLMGYRDVVEVFPDCVIVLDDEGVLRFQENRLTRWLVDIGGVNLNQLVVARQKGFISPEEMMEFYQGLGYSLCGFCEIFGENVTNLHEQKKCVRNRRVIARDV